MPRPRRRRLARRTLRPVVPLQARQTSRQRPAPSSSLKPPQLAVTTHGHHRGSPSITHTGRRHDAIAVMRSDRSEAAAILAGGALGALARTRLAVAFPASGWPWVTFAVNLAGAFALGYFVTRLQERLPLSAYKRPLLGTGFCGALTTFSTVQLA